MTTYERIEPEGRCVSPDGHSLVEYRPFTSPIPTTVLCRRCGKQGTVVVFEDDDRTDPALDEWHARLRAKHREYGFD